jgi:hypothetical protein
LAQRLRRSTTVRRGDETTARLRRAVTKSTKHTKRHKENGPISMALPLVATPAVSGRRSAAPPTDAIRQREALLLCGLCVLCGSSCRGSRRGAVEPR